MALRQKFSSYHWRLQINRSYKFYQEHLGWETGLLSTRIRFRNFSVSDDPLGRNVAGVYAATHN